MIHLVPQKTKTEHKHRDTSLSLTHTHLFHVLCTLAHTQADTHSWSGQPENSHEASWPSFGRETRPDTLSRTQSPCETPPGGKGRGRPWPWRKCHLDFKHPYLCVKAIFSLSFSDLRCVSAGPTWEAFSSSVPFTLDAWVEDRVSHPDSGPKWVTFTHYCW